MKASRWLLGSAIALAAPFAAAAQTGSFSPQRLSDIDKTISSDAFQGRGTASAIEPKVIAYIADQFRAAGVQPGGDLVGGKRSWYQKVPLLESQIVGTPQISLNENGTIVPLQQGPEIAVLAPLNGASRIDIENAPLVFVGYGVDAPSAAGTTSRARTCMARSWSRWSTTRTSRPRPVSRSPASSAARR
jgi:hypothetical protein